MTQPVKYYIKELLNIALPIIIGNLGFILIGAGDVLIAGRHSTDTLAAISIATAITNCIMTFGIGLIVSVSPILSNYRGEKKQAKKYFFPTLRFAMFVAFIVMLIILGCIPLIDCFRFEPHLVPMVKQYMLITAFATFGGYLHAAVKEFLQAFEIVMFPNILTFLCVFLNIGLNLILVFGYGPIPSLGVVGLAIASFIIRYFMGFVLLIYCFKQMNFSNYKEFDYYKQLVKIGLPISFAILVEFVAFNIVALAMGRVAGIYAAAQNLICTLTTVSFMIPLAISNAIAVKVGFANGAENYIDLRRYSKIGVFISLGFMACSALVFASFPHFLVGLFTKDSALIAVCVPIMYILACFQIFDGLQVSLSGICKGIKKTNIVLLANFVAYWVISIPVGFVLAFRYNLGIIGFWYGLIVSSITLCIIMLLMLRKYFKKIHIA
ncbi:MATE family efflux transporter [bacterium]|nr:MATE family efflux transporter [bacterium]